MKEKGYMLLVVDNDTCIKTDNPVIKDDCGACEYYCGFELYNARPCIKCSASLESVADDK